jgi:hypothetical protein
MHGIFFFTVYGKFLYNSDAFTVHSLLALTQQVKYLAECVKEIANNSKKESKEPESVVYGIPGPSGTSGSQLEPIVISDNEITIKEENGEKKEKKGATNKKGKGKEREKPETTTGKKHKKKQTVSEKAKGKARARSVSVSSTSSRSSSSSSSSNSSSGSNKTFYFKKEYMPKDLREALRVNNDIPFLLIVIRFLLTDIIYFI